jgi:hypothetical protein
MDPKQAKEALSEHPVRFLRSYPVSIAGHHGASGAHMYGIHYHQTYIPGTTLGNERFKIEALVDARACSPYHAFQAHTIKMIGWSDLHDDGHSPITLAGYTLDALAPGLMMTGQLSGCAFCMLRVGTTVICTHIQPTGTDGATMQNALQARGAFAGHPAQPLTIFGRNNYAAYASVMGVRKAGEWRVYAQHLNSPTVRTAEARIL